MMCMQCKEFKLDTVIQINDSCDCLYHLDCCNIELVLNSVYHRKECRYCNKKLDKNSYKRLEYYLQIIKLKNKYFNYDTNKGILLMDFEKFYFKLIQRSINYSFFVYGINLEIIHKYSIYELLSLYLKNDIAIYFLNMYKTLCNICNTI